MNERCTLVGPNVADPIPPRDQRDRPVQALRRILRSALGFLLATALAAPVLASQEAFSLSSKTNSLVVGHQAGSAGPQGDWDRQSSVIAGSGVRVISPNDQSGSAAREAEVRDVAKALYAETVLASSGTIATWAATGTLYAVEFDILGADDPVAPPLPTEHLGTTGELSGVDANGQATVLGTMYCYDYPQYQARVAALNGKQGGTLASDRTVYHGPLLQASNGGSYAIYLTTDDSELHGDLLSNGGIRIDGDGHTVEGDLRAVGTVDVSGIGNVTGPVIVEAQESPLPAPRKAAAQYQNLAMAGSCFFNQDVRIVSDGVGGFETSDGLPVSGVVYTTGDIVVEAAGTSGSLTLVAEGSIELAGAGNTLKAAVDDLLVWAIKDPLGQTDNDVIVSGDGNVLTGKIFARGGMMQVASSDMTLTGNLIAWKILVSGDGHTIGDGTDD